MISPHSIGKRDADGALHRVRLKAFGERHELQLEPSDGLLVDDKLRAWTAHHNATTDTVHYTELPHDVSVYNSFVVSPTGRAVPKPKVAPGTRYNFGALPSSIFFLWGGAASFSEPCFLAFQPKKVVTRPGIVKYFFFYS